jgi:malonyl-CoA O-methyltransferase
MIPGTYYTIANRFSAAAATYNNIAQIQPQVVSELNNMMEKKENAIRILEVGAGTGLLTLKITENYPNAQIHAIDISARMLDEAKKRLTDFKNIRLQTVNLLDLESMPRYDLIISSSSLHWIQPFEPVIAKLAGLLNPGGKLLAGLMIKGTLPELHQSRSSVAPHKPTRAAFPGSAEISKYIKQHYLKIINFKEKTYKAVYADAETFIRHLHMQGLTGGKLCTSNYPLTKNEIRQLVKIYDNEYTTGNKVYASYRVCFVEAGKA